MAESTPTTRRLPFDAGHYVLGIDGGGTRTVALLAHWFGRDRPVEDFTIVGRGVSGPSNHRAVGRERALAALDDAVNQAFAAAGVPREPVPAACLGLAGADRPADRELLSRWAFSVFLADKLRVENDGRIVLAAGTPDECGLALIAGTGSFALARNSQGKIVRAGGWGYLLGDDCGAYSIALAGLRAVARAADGSGPATEMTGAFLRRLNIASPAELIPKIYGELDRPAIAGLADVVTSAAAAGDVAANMILLGEADRLAAAAYSALQSASLTDSETVPAALAGSVLTSCPAIVDRIASALLNRGLKLDPIQLVEEPAQGAIRLARAIL